MARPKIEIDFDVIEELASKFNTKEDIAEHFGCCVETIENRIKEKFNSCFSEVYKKGTARGRKSLRAKMYELAMNGNVTMLIWLSKQYLGMSDKVESKQTLDATTVNKISTIDLAFAAAEEKKLKQQNAYSQ